MIFVYRTGTGWGSVARSRDPGLHGRKPLFATPRALALSYVECYVDYTGAHQGLRGGGPARAGQLRLAAVASGNVWKVERMLLDWPHRRITSSNARIDAMRKRYVAFREAHGYKPWRYYKGRERWAPLPPEFRYRG